MKVLYVDDEDINLYLFKASFKNNFEVITAQSGPEALNILASRSDIDKVITDMKMPEMNGLEFVFKAVDLGYKIPFYLLTGFDKTPEIEDALKQKVILHYFRKPFDKLEIIEILEN